MMKTSDVHILRSNSTDRQPRRRAVLLFARSPLSEARAKRIRGLDFADRLKLFTTLTRQAIRTASESGFELVVATDVKAPIFRENATHVIEQRGVGFGERLLNAVHDLFSLGYDEVALIGNDSPELCGATIRDALIAKQPGALRLCRAADGGVTMLSLDRENAQWVADLFMQSRWETSFLFEDLLQTAQAYGIPVEECEGGNDLDSLGDLIRLLTSSSLPPELRRLTVLLPSEHFYPPNTNPYTRPHRHTLRACRQKAPPSLLLSSAS